MSQVVSGSLVTCIFILLFIKQLLFDIFLANTASYFCAFVFFVTFIPHFGLDSQYADMTRSQRMALCLINNMAMAIGLTTAVEYEVTGTYTSLNTALHLYHLSHHNFNKSFLVLNNVSLESNNATKLENDLSVSTPVILPNLKMICQCVHQ